MNDHESVRSLLSLLGYLDASMHVALLQAQVSEEETSFYERLGEMRSRCVELLSSLESHESGDVAGQHVPLEWLSRATQELHRVYSGIASTAA